MPPQFSIFSFDSRSACPYNGLVGSSYIPKKGSAVGRKDHMGLFDKTERKFGRYAIPNLMLYIIILYVGGFILISFFDWGLSFYLTNLSLDWSMILKGQVWRIVTFIMYPPDTGILWFLLFCYVFYSIGRSLERLWGSFYFNLYVFIGLFALILAALLVYVITGEILLLTTSDLYMSFLLALAVTIPEARFYYFMVIPIKAKYLAIFYGLLMVFEMITGDWTVRVSILASLLNFIVFFLFIRRPVRRVKQVIRRAQFEAKVRQSEGPKGAPKHRCAVCGRTELDAPELEFRYCSKCAGGREYCMEHLYTHVHVTEQSGTEER